MSDARLLISCADRPGVVAGIAGFLYRRGANITDSHQHSSDPEGGRFFMRLEFVLEGMDATAFERDFAADVGGPLGLHWRITHAARPQRVAVLVSREDHCLLDLLWRWRRGELPGDIVLVASNHPDHAAAVGDFGLPYHHVPVERERKPDAEARLLARLDGACDVVVLARYMQILSGNFLERLGRPVINIHHSFLPAFAGAQPYRQAAERGVKIIGATAHYVTEELDAGPIIEQDVHRVSHADSVAELERIGRDVERTVLARAVRWHLEDRVIVDGPRTIVF